MKSTTFHNISDCTVTNNSLLYHNEIKNKIDHNMKKRLACEIFFIMEYSWRGAFADQSLPSLGPFPQI